MQQDYTFGIEEEYFLSNSETRRAVKDIPRKFISTLRKEFPGEVQREMLQSQIEIATPVCNDMGEARASLSRLREGLATIAGENGLLVLACGTHPTAIWSRQRPTEAARYDRLMRDLQMLGSRNQVCGMHVHVALPDDERRVDVMNRVMPFLPLILALSTSSPFWQAQRTGLMGYRLSAYRELPRTGLPELFTDVADYRHYIDTMVEAGAITDSSFVWWALRLSKAHPTLELRVADSCTRLEDSLAVAALFRALVRHLDRNRSCNAGLTSASRAIASENIWRAQRYGIHGGFVCETRRAMIGVGEVLEETLALLEEDARALGCEAELAYCREILRLGTSADVQLALYEDAVVHQGDRARALTAVVDWLARETAGISAFQPGSIGHA